MEDKFDFIRDKCIEANPSRAEGWDVDSGRPTGSGYLDRIPCRLADILLAIQKAHDKHPTDWYAISALSIFLENKVKEITATPFAHQMISAGTSWNFYKDDLEQQPPETIDFLYQLLS